MSLSSPTAIELSELLSNAQLPGLPHSAIKIMEMSRDSQIGPADLAVPIEADPGLAGQVLRFVNSSYFGFSNEISNVKLAIALVGVRTINNFALWSAVFSTMPNPRCGPLDLKTLWQDSLRRALLSRHLVKRAGKQGAEEAFAAALLQDIAVPVLAKELPNEYTELLSERQGGAQRLSDLERQRFGWTHAEAGGQLARIWHLPEDLARLIEGHVDAEPAATDPAQRLLQSIVALSAKLPSAVDEQWLDQAQFEQGYEQLPLTEPAAPVAEVLAKIDAEFIDLAPALKLRTAARPLADYYRPGAVAEPLRQVD